MIVSQIIEVIPVQNILSKLFLFLAKLLEIIPDPEKTYGNYFLFVVEIMLQNMNLNVSDPVFNIL